METSNKIKWTNVPVDLNVAYLKRKIVEAFDGLSIQATLVKQEIDSGRIDRAKNRLTLVEEYIEEFKEEINI